MKLERIKKKNIFLLLLPALFFISFVFASEVNAITFNQQIPIPGVATSTIQPSGNTRAIGEYIKGVYNYGIGIVAILATVVMMFGGFQWIIAGGSAEKVGEAKAWIGASLTGLVLALSSYTILSMVNPNLTSLTVRTIRTVDPVVMGCCEYKEEEKTFSAEMSSFNCDGKGKDKITFMPGGKPSTSGCVTPEDILVCCIIKYETFLSGTRYDCYQNIKASECKQGGIMIDWENSTEIVKDESEFGSCASMTQPRGFIPACNLKN